MDVVPVGYVLIVHNLGRHARVRVRAPQVFQELVQERLRKAVDDCAQDSQQPQLTSEPCEDLTVQAV